MISLQKFIGGTWEYCRGYLKLDIDHLQDAINSIENRLLGGASSQTLNPDVIEGSPTPVPRYVASTGTKNAPKWDQVDLASVGVKGRLPYSRLQPSTAASRLLGRESGSPGDWEEVTLGPGLTMTGSVLSASAAATSIITPLTVDPVSPTNGTGWFFDDGGTPASLSFRWRKAGVTYDFPIGTATT